MESLQALFIALDGGLELTDILGATFTESRLRLSVALLTFFGGRIDLDKISQVGIRKAEWQRV